MMSIAMEELADKWAKEKLSARFSYVESQCFLRADCRVSGSAD